MGGGSRSSGGSGGLPILIGGGCGGGIGLLVIIVVVGPVLVQMQQRGLPAKGAGIGDGSGGYAPPSAQAGFGVITARDPDFNEQMFYGRVNEMFTAIQNAWMGKDMEPARRFLSDQQFDVLNTGVAEYVKNGTGNKLDGMHVDRIEPVEVTSAGDYDTVKLRITATSIDYTVDERTGQLVNPAELGDGKTPSTFSEDWTFIRKASAQSKMEDTIQKCPNCGAPVTDGNYVKCAYCGTQMNDPALDWVLLRIEQV